MLVVENFEASILGEDDSTKDFGLVENYGMIGKEKKYVGLCITIDLKLSKEIG